MKALGSVSTGPFNLIWLLHVCCCKYVSYQATQAEGREVWYKWNPTTVTTTQRARSDESKSVMPSTEKKRTDRKWKSRNSHIRHLSHEIHTFLLLQRWMVNCVWMKHKNGYQWATSLVEWVTQKQVTFLLGSRFWQADPHSKLSLLNRIHQITPPHAPYL